MSQIVGAQFNGTHAKHGQRPQEWGLAQCKYYCSMKHNDPAVLKGIDTHSEYNMAPWVRKGVSATSQSGRYTLSYPSDEHM